ncbi:MAG: lipid-A-disaccharide synthase [Idiomarina sp.]|nr:lipid-A-disaccharide synthase [Idiomarina sp.]MCL4409748.1 lipid-A-disaccharide synthase [Gammaproteobacteria bacterium]MCL5048937.1 lipid-A-disaccharide synthase [Bacillota bacterium]
MPQDLNHQSNPVRCIGLVAGEASGDILGASLMRAIKQRHPEVEFIGVGGPLMAAEGLQSLFSFERLAVMGIVDVLKQLPDLLAARREVVTCMLNQRPDIFVGIDAPDFNIPIELKLKQAGITCVHYVSPSVWAWRQKRVFKIAKATHRVLCLLPFEKQFYDRFDVPATFVGHTLADEIPLQSSRELACEALNIDPQQRYFGVLPGSRRSEVGLLIEPFLQAARILHDQHPEYGFLIPAVNPERRGQIEAAIATASLPASLQLHIIDQQSRQVMLASDALMLASGTVSLEAMLLKRPMVVSYRFSALNYAILKRLVKVDYFSLPNLIANQPLVPELLQEAVTPEALATHMSHFISQPQQALLAQFEQLHQAIALNAADTAADAVLATHQQRAL